MTDEGEPDTACAAVERPAEPVDSGGRLVSAAGLQWHVRELGAGPPLLLVHGTGASMHSWFPLAPLLADSFKLVMIDLPGHGQSSLPRRLAIEDMSAALGGLLGHLELAPKIAVGHSAGAAVLVQMCLERRLSPSIIVSLNGALLPFGGAANHLFGPFARMLAIAPLVPRLVSSKMATREAVARLVGRLGSTIPPAQLDDYVRLLHSEKHITAALRMMAHWDLQSFAGRLPALDLPIELVVCEQDRAVPASQADRLAGLLPRARVHRLAGLGHLGHEEDPARFRELISGVAREAGLIFDI